MKEYTVKVNWDGSKFWYLDGKKHREDGPAIEWSHGSKSWWLDGKQHREDGPAVEYADGSKFWWLDNKLHREDGPAVECADGTKEFWLNDFRITEEEHKKRTSKATCSGKVVEIDGIKYELKEV